MKVIIVVFLLLFCSIGGASAWYDGFDYRIPITIDNAGNPTLEDYQFNVSFSSGINETSIRVVNDTDYTIVPHWCENETDGLCYELWFNLSVGSEVNTDYYIYYGNDSISSTSDYDNTFTKKYNDTGLVLELHMDEGTGNSVAVDSSGEGNDGTLTNMNVTGDDTSGWQGTDGGQWDNRSDMVFSGGDHLRIDGTNDYVNCGAEVINNPEAFTISSWVKYEADPPTFNGMILSKYNFDIYSRALSSEIRFTTKTSAGTQICQIPFSSIDSMEWNIITCVYDGVTANIYLNGVYVSGDPQTGNILDTSIYNLELGKKPTSTLYFNGSIDEVRVYNRSLSTDEIYRQYVRSKYAANTPLISIGYTEKIPHPFLSGAYPFYGEMTDGLTDFKDEMSRYLIWGVVFFAVSLAFALIGKIKSTLIGGK